MVMGSADGLHLRNLCALGRRFNLILLGAVRMHGAPSGRKPAFRIHSELLGPSGLLVVRLRSLAPLANPEPGLVIERTEDYVDIPFGAVGLYWLIQYLPLVLHQRLSQHREDAGALHHLSGTRRSSVVRVGVFPGTGNRPAHCTVAPETCAVRPLPESRAVMAGARPVRLPAGSGHRPEMAPVAGEPAERDEVGSRRVRQRDCGSG